MKYKGTKGNKRNHIDDSGPLKELRHLLKTYTRRELAYRLDIGEQYLCDIIVGRRSVSDYVGERLGYKKSWIKKRKA